MVHSLPIAAEQAFYGTAAQIIPILLLTMAFGETRFRASDDDLPAHWMSAMAIVFVVILMVFSELAALRVLAIGADSTATYVMTSVGLIIGSVFIVARAALGGLADLEGRYPSELLNVLAVGLGLLGLACWFSFGSLLFVGV
jgi:hypothetical protein